MAEHIERDNVYEGLRSLLNDIYDDTEHSAEFARGFEQALRCAADNVTDIPAADVFPERHGEWRRSYDGYSYFCSICGEEPDRNSKLLSNFCPWCGAKMDGSGKSDKWIATSEQLPVENQIVETKIDDENGVRNEQELIYSHNLWFLPDKSIYVYYTPTHWRRSERTGGKDGESDGV